MSSSPYSDRNRRRSYPKLFSPGSIILTAAAAYGAYYFWKNVWKEPTDDNEVDPDRYAPRVSGRTAAGQSKRDKNSSKWKMRRLRMIRCREETQTALRGFLPTMRRIIEEETNTAKETQILKQLRAERTMPESSLQRALLHTTKDESCADQIEAARRKEEAEQWDSIKIQSFTRMIATAYAHTIVFLVLTVQVNLLGGRLLDEQLKNTSSSASLSNDSLASDRISSYQATHHFVLTHTYERFFDDGLKSMIKAIKETVADVLDNWSASDKAFLELSQNTFDEALRDIRTRLETSHAKSHKLKMRSLVRYLIPPSAYNSSNEIDDAMAASILDETWDILESPVLLDAQREVLETTFAIMREAHWGGLFFDPETEEEVKKPLAIVLTQIKKTANSFYDTYAGVDEERKINAYGAAIEKLPSVLELADVSFD